MFGIKNKITKYAEENGGLETILSELLSNLKTEGYFISESKANYIMLKQEAIKGFNVIDLKLISNNEIISNSLKRGGGPVKKKIFNLDINTQENIAKLIIQK